jgi:hypothetical protein
MNSMNEGSDLLDKSPESIVIDSLIQEIRPEGVQFEEPFCRDVRDLLAGRYKKEQKKGSDTDYLKNAIRKACESLNDKTKDLQKKPECRDFLKDRQLNLANTEVKKIFKFPDYVHFVGKIGFGRRGVSVSVERIGWSP